MNVKQKDAYIENNLLTNVYKGQDATTWAESKPDCLDRHDNVSTDKQ